MKIKSLTLILAIVSIFISCDNDTTIAKSYNDQLNKVLGERQIQIKLLQSSISKDLLIGEPDKVIADCKKAQALIEETRVKIKEIVPPNLPRASVLQTGCINLLQWNKLYFEKVSKLAEAKTDKERMASSSSLDSCTTNIQYAEAMLDELHKDFAHQNGAQTKSEVAYP